MLKRVGRFVYYPIHRAWIRFRCWYEDRWDNPGMPPALLRYRVAGTPDVQSFLAVGERSCDAIVASLEAAGRPVETCEKILDFGCGCGRTLTWLARRLPDKRFYGADVDEPAIAWCRDHYSFAEFRATGALPPLDYPDSAFDLIYAVSVFTHLDEEFQFRWLAELSRILKPDGVLLFTLHGEKAWSILTPADIREVASKGFLFRSSSKLEGFFPEWYQTTFHSAAYIKDELGKRVKIVAYIPEGMGYQDIVIANRLG